MRKTLLPYYNFLFRDGYLLIIILIVFFSLSRMKHQHQYLDILSNLGFQIFLGGVLLSLIFLLLKRLYACIICFCSSIIYFLIIYFNCSNCNVLVEKNINNKNHISLMTFNTSLSKKIDLDAIINIAEEESVDIIQLQEVSSDLLEKINNIKNIYPYSTLSNKKLNIFDSLIISKFPLTQIKDGPYNLLSSSILKEDLEILLLGIHLVPVLNNQTKDYANNQIQYIKNYLKRKKNKDIILLGDLNMTHTSNRFEDFLSKTNLFTNISYFNLNSTWHTVIPKFLGIQIDHILFSKKFSFLKNKTLNNFNSDHRPLIFKLKY